MPDVEFQLHTVPPAPLDDFVRGHTLVEQVLEAFSAHPADVVPNQVLVHGFRTGEVVLWAEGAAIPAGHGNRPPNNPIFKVRGDLEH